MSPAVYVTAGIDGRIAMFFKLFNIVIIKGVIMNKLRYKIKADILKSMFHLYIFLIKQLGYEY